MNITSPSKAHDQYNFMPPTQNLLGYTIRGFVCKTCLSKLRQPLHQKTPQLKRTLASKNRAPKPSRPSAFKQAKEELSIRYYEETPNGRREEVLEDGEERALERDADLEELSRQAGIDHEDLIEALGNNADFLAPDKIFENMGDDARIGQALQALQTQNRQLQDELQKLGYTPDSNDAIQLPPFDLSEFLLSQESQNLTSKQEQHEPQAVSSISHPDRNKSSASSTRPVPRPPLQIGQDDTLQEQTDMRCPQAGLLDHKDIQALLNAVNSPIMAKQKRQKLTRKVRSTAINPTASVWKSYLKARKLLLSYPRETSQHIWSALWNYMASSGQDNFDRMSHLRAIGEDMYSVDIPLPASQELLYIEATFVTGERDRALELWSTNGDTIDPSERQDLKLYRQLGIRMFCAQGDITSVKPLAQAVFDESTDHSDYRILIPIIKTCLQHENAEGVEQAWKLYKRMRLGLGAAMEMADYDSIVSMFLAADRADLALQVFTDMMLVGESSATLMFLPESTIDFGRLELDSHTDYALVEGGKTLLHVTDTNTSTTLPADVNNKIFFGKWTKKLIGDGELDGVKKVFDLMADRGMVPLPIHMNGLIGAWVREGSQDSLQKAEELAWKMIDARIKYATERTLMSGLAPPLRTVTVQGNDGINSLFKVPFATMETFTILLQQYRRRQRAEKFPALFDAVNQAQLPIDTVFINELLWLDTRERHKGWVWQTYQSLMNRKATRPDYVTFTILWQNMKKQEDPVIGRKSKVSSDNFTTCRLLFNDMIHRTAYLREKGREFRRELYELVILSFCYSQDVEGTAVALQALQKYYNIYPNVDTARSVIVQLARLDLVVQYGQDRRLLRNAGGRQRVEEVTQIFEVLKERRKEVLKEQGLIFEELSPELKREESLVMLLELLRYAFDARRGNNILTESSSRVAATRAAAEMGVPGCNPWSDERISALDLTVR